MADTLDTPKRAAVALPVVPRKGLSMRAREELIAYALIAPWVIGFLIFTAGALVFSLGISFFNTDLLSPAKFVGLSNYQQLFFDDELFWQALKVTTLYTLGVVPVQVGLGLLVALLLNQKIFGIGVWRTIFYLPSVVSGVAVAMIWIWFFQPDLGLFNFLLEKIGVAGIHRLASLSLKSRHCLPVGSITAGPHNPCSFFNRLIGSGHQRGQLQRLLDFVNRRL